MRDKKDNFKSVVVTFDLNRTIDKIVYDRCKHTAKKLQGYEIGDVLIEITFGKILCDALDYKFHNGKKPSRNLFKHYVTIDINEEVET